MESRTESLSDSAWLYAAFVFVLLAALAFAPNPSIFVVVAVVLVLFRPGSAPSSAILGHQPHP
jgi:hypothetical protein